MTFRMSAFTATKSTGDAAAPAGGAANNGKVAAQATRASAWRLVLTGADTATSFAHARGLLDCPARTATVVRRREAVKAVV
jgi:hypothetical protein